MNNERFNVQCLSGHTWSVSSDSELGKRAKARGDRGFLDALPVPCRECEDCEIESERATRGLMVDSYTNEPRPIADFIEPHKGSKCFGTPGED